MVSRIIKRTPTKPSKDRRPRRRKKSPFKNVANASSIVIASINNSIYACHRRLIRIFAKITAIGTPKRQKQGFHLLKKFPQEEHYNDDDDHEEQEQEEMEEEEQEEEEEVIKRVNRSMTFRNVLPPMSSRYKRTIFLDLDETLIHSQTDPPPQKYDFVVRPTIQGELLNFYVLKRPGVDELLESMAKKFEIVVFTAGLQEYASLVLDRLDSKKAISHRLYRDSCKELAGKFAKDLSELGRDLKNVVLVDDNPNAYVLQPENAFPVMPFFDDVVGDRELKKVMKFFMEVADGFEDMRDALKSYQMNLSEEREL